MSDHDDRKAALILQRRRHYCLDGKPKPRRRYQGVTTAGFVLFGLICLLARCSYAP